MPWFVSYALLIGSLIGLTINAAQAVGAIL